MTPLPPGISRIFKWGLLTTLGQTCQPPKGKNLEILNLKLGKVVRTGEKAARCLNYRVTWRNLQQGLRVNKVAFHVKLEQ